MNEKNWKQNSPNWTRFDEKEKEKEEEEENWKYKSNSEHKIAILVFGKSGVGKSSLIRTMTNNKPTTTSTKECEFYLDNGILWINTKNALDVELNQESQDTLKNIGKNCYQNDVNSLKFIWCIDKSTQYDRQLDKEAQS